METDETDETDETGMAGSGPALPDSSQPNRFVQLEGCSAAMYSMMSTTPWPEPVPEPVVGKCQNGRWSCCTRNIWLTLAPHSHTRASPHEHIENTMGLPVALSAFDMFPYSSWSVKPLGKPQWSILTMSTPHSASVCASRS